MLFYSLPRFFVGITNFVANLVYPVLGIKIHNILIHFINVSNVDWYIPYNIMVEVVNKMVWGKKKFENNT